MNKIIIAALAENGVIGKDGDIPWHHPKDLKHFKQLTTGNPVIMGRKTYESLPENYQPLPNRTNIVLTNSDFEADESVEVANSLEEAYNIAKSLSENAFIIGGASVYKQALDTADKLVLTEIHESYEGDTYFPEINDENWKETKREDEEELSFVTYQRT